MTQPKPPSPDPTSRSGGITVGDQTAQGNVTTHLENVAGRDQISHSQVVQHADNVYLVQKPGFSEKPGFSKLQLPLDEIPKPTSLPPGSRMLMGLNPHFVGRERELKQLAQVLQTGDTAAIGQLATITGLGGVGKSQLAIAFAHHYGPLFAGGVFWLNLSDGANVPAELAQCGYAMQLGDGYDGLTLDEQVRRVQREWQEAIPRLLLFDNCEDETLLAQWRPKTGGCRVLATSRRSTWDVSLGVSTLPLDTLTPPESRALLLSLLFPLKRPLPTDISGVEALAGSADLITTLDAIAEELGHLPLALHLAGSYLHTYRHAPFAQPAAYLAELQNERLEHPSLQGEGTSYSPTEHEQHVGRTFALSLERLNPDDVVDQLALALLARSAHFAPSAPIPRALLLATAGVTGDNRSDQLQGEKAMARLVGLGLLMVEAATGWPIIHRLVAAFVQTQIEDRRAQLDVEETIGNKARQTNQSEFPQDLLPWQSHLRYVTEQALARKDEMTVSLMNNLANWLHNIGDYVEAYPLYERALFIKENILGVEHPSLAHSLNNLAVLVRIIKGEMASYPLFERAITIQKKVLEHDPSSIGSLTFMALLYRNMGDYTTARTFYERALTIKETTLGVDHPDITLHLNKLADLLDLMEDYAAARPLLERALSITERTLGTDHPNTASSLNNLAELLRKTGDFTTARPLYERALSIRENSLRPNHPDVAHSLKNLAELLRKIGEFAAARPLLERAITIFENAMGPNHSYTAQSLNQLAWVLEDMGEYAAARSLLERSLSIQEHVLGPDSLNTAHSLYDLASLLKNMGDFSAVRPLMQRALAIFEQRLDQEHPTTRLVRDNLASLGQ